MEETAFDGSNEEGKVAEQDPSSIAEMDPRVQKNNGKPDQPREEENPTKHHYMKEQHKQKPTKTHRWWSLKMAIASLLFVVYVVIPFIFANSTFIRCHIIFLNWVNLSYDKNLSVPTSYGLNCTRSFFIPSGDGRIKLGAWHILPGSLQNKCQDNTIDPSMEFEDNRPVILYLHGNAGTRGSNHRLQLYNVLAYSFLDAHVVAIDYRGFGDSSNVYPTSTGITKDAISAFEWLTERIPSDRILIWGHSLGTGVAVGMGTILSKGKTLPMGYVLVSPFTTIPEAVFNYPLAIFYRYMPKYYFDLFFTNAFAADNNTRFDSLDNISRITSPILIFHAKDDVTVPYHLGYKLYSHGKKVKADGHSLKLVSFDAKHGFGHTNIWKFKGLPHMVSNFFKL